MSTSPSHSSTISKPGFVYPSWALVVGSILSTVLLVLVNKSVFTAGFPFVLSLSTLHLFTTFLVMFTLSRCFHVFEPKSIPFANNVLVAGMGVGSIAFMNYSLRFNSVGMYQMAKLCIIPVVLVFNALKGEYPSRKVLAALSLVLLGVGVATVTDMQASLAGLVYAFAAVVSTAQYQIWQGSKQREYKLSDMQMTQCVSQMQGLICLVAALYVEGEDVYEHLFVETGLSIELVLQVLLSCLLAVSVNAHSFALIGRTSAVTFQVVGHGKTCLIILSGYLLVSPFPPMREFLNNFAGVSLAVFGVILYGNLKMHEGKGTLDWCDLYLLPKAAGLGKTLGSEGGVGGGTKDKDEEMAALNAPPSPTMAKPPAAVV